MAKRRKSEAASAEPGIPKRQRRRKRLFGIALGLATAASGVAAFWLVPAAISTASLGAGPPEAGPAAFVGSEACAGCHQAEAKLWHGSQHQRAMDHATEKSVLGDFNDASFDYYGVHSRFFRQGGKFLVETDGPDGKPATFAVKYTFGLDPLQQYLVEFPDGRVQALSLAWDTRPKDKGGQRWFHLYPDEEIKHDDVLHWTKLNQNWNFMCAECHSTGVHKNYDAAADRFATSFAEISVGCEACHGQGSRHVGWAQARQSWWPFGKPEEPNLGLLVRFGERDGVAWHRNPVNNEPERSIPPAILRKEVETCGLCHARRGTLSEDWVPGRWLSDTHAVSPLARGLYEADGQMHDEVYNYGSFKQSRMFAAGVTCADCHDPHSAALRTPGDGTCLQCHAPDRYAVAAHRHHETASAPPACASCHMPARTYMVVDRRHDHSFRVPRPDLSVALGTPNACNDCHTDKSADWAAAAVTQWHGPAAKGFQNYAEAFYAAWTDDAEAEKLLAAVAADARAPAVARAGALDELASRVSPSNLDVARKGMTDTDPMVRIGALDMLDSVPPAQLWPLVAPLLSDPVRGVRIRAAALLAGAPSVPAADRERFEKATAEFVAAQRLNADRPEARSMLAAFDVKRGQLAEAETEYKAALALSPAYARAAANLADLYRRLKRDDEGDRVLRTALVTSPGDAGLHHALGLALVRTKRMDEALGELQRATQLDPGLARYAYVYAVALDSAGRRADAMATLKDALARHPQDRELLLALVGYSRQDGDLAGALVYAEALAKIAPSDRELTRLIEDLRGNAKRPDAP